MKHKRILVRLSLKKKGLRTFFSIDDIFYQNRQLLILICQGQMLFTLFKAKVEHFSSFPHYKLQNLALRQRLAGCSCFPDPVLNQTLVSSVVLFLSPMLSGKIGKAFSQKYFQIYNRARYSVFALFISTENYVHLNKIKCM